MTTLLREVGTFRGICEVCVLYLTFIILSLDKDLHGEELDIFEFRLAFGQYLRRRIDKLYIFQEQNVITWTWRACFSSLDVSSVYGSCSS